MPMDRSRYPENWDEVATQIKDAAGWECQGCGRPCKRPDEDWIRFIDRVVFKAFGCECPEALALLNEITDRNTRMRFVLTVAHLDQDPGNQARSNLKALCSVCHLQHDRPFRQHNRMAKLERRGQQNLFDLAAPVPGGHSKDPKKNQLPLRDEVV